MLKACYLSCMELAGQNKIHSIAFCCISTGEYHFANGTAAEIAVNTVRNYLIKDDPMKVIFNVFKDIDYDNYNKLL